MLGTEVVGTGVDHSAAEAFWIITCTGHRQHPELVTSAGIFGSQMGRLPAALL